MNHAELAALIPHAGSMVLLDGVVSWDDERIVCQSDRHRDPANPLAVGRHLSSVCGVEFAAQAMAVHGALLGRRDHHAKPRAGFLASVRGVELHVARLDDVAGVLTIEASREAGDGNQVLYSFDVRSGYTSLVSGRAAVVLDMGEAGST